MLAKLVMIVIALALTGASLLAVRQQRLQAVSDMATAIERASALDRQTWRARIEIARRVSPEALEPLIAEMGAFEPMLVEWCEFIEPRADSRSEPAHGG
jgi:hypothetical protein